MNVHKAEHQRLQDALTLLIEEQIKMKTQLDDLKKNQGIFIFILCDAQRYLAYKQLYCRAQHTRICHIFGSVFVRACVRPTDRLSMRSDLTCPNCNFIMGSLKEKYHLLCAY